MSFIYESGNLTLAQEAQAKMKEFEEKKTRRKKEWVKELIKLARTDILLKASLGENNTVFCIGRAVHEIKPITVHLDGKKETYEIKREDKDYLMTEVIKHYSDEKEYPYLTCRPANGYTNEIFFGWDFEEIKDE